MESYEYLTIDKRIVPPVKRQIPIGSHASKDIAREVAERYHGEGGNLITVTEDDLQEGKGK